MWYIIHLVIIMLGEQKKLWCSSLHTIFLRFPVNVASYTWNLKDRTITLTYLPWIRPPSRHNVIHNNTPQRMCNHRYFATTGHKIWVSLCKHGVQPIQFLWKTTLNLKHRSTMQIQGTVQALCKTPTQSIECCQFLQDVQNIQNFD